MPAPPVLVTFAPQDQGVAPTLEELKEGIQGLGAAARETSETTRRGWSDALISFRAISQGVTQASADVEAGTITTTEYSAAIAKARAEAIRLRTATGDLSSKELSAYAGIIRQTTTGTAGATVQFDKMRTGVVRLAASAAGVPGPFGAIASRVLEFSASGALVGGAVLGIGLIVKALRQKAEEAAKARDRIKEVLDEVRKLREARIPGLALETSVEEARKQLDAAMERFRTLRRGEERVVGGVDAPTTVRIRDEQAIRDASRAVIALREKLTELELANAKERTELERQAAQEREAVFGSELLLVRELRQMVSELRTLTLPLPRGGRLETPRPGNLTDLLPVDTAGLREGIATEPFLELREVMEGVIDTTGLMQQAFSSVFATIADGGKVSGAALASGILKGISQSAGAKGAFYLAEGFAALAASIFPFPRPDNAWSASQYFTAAGLMFGIAGGAALGARAIGGGGRGAAGAGIPDSRSLVDQSRVEREPLEVHVYGAINPLAPDFVERMAVTMAEISGRNVNLHLHEEEEP